MKRNDVVYPLSEAPYTFYGRIVKIVGDRALWINVKGESYNSLLSDLEQVNYKGRWDHKWDYHSGELVSELWLPMPTLKKLKQRAKNFYGGKIYKEVFGD